MAIIRAWEVVTGSNVVDVNGEKLGTVDRIQGQHIVISKGWLFPSEHAVPETAIASADGDSVHLKVTKDVVLNQAWGSDRPADQPPGERVNDG